MGYVPPRMIPPRESEPPQGGSVIAHPIIDLASAGKYSAEEISQALTLMANARIPFPEWAVEERYEIVSIATPGWFARFWFHFLAGCGLIAHYVGFPCEPPPKPKQESGYYIVEEREYGDVATFSASESTAPFIGAT